MIWLSCSRVELRLLLIMPVELIWFGTVGNSTIVRDDWQGRSMTGIDKKCTKILERCRYIKWTFRQVENNVIDKVKSSQGTTSHKLLVLETQNFGIVNSKYCYQSWLAPNPIGLWGRWSVSGHPVQPVSPLRVKKILHRQNTMFTNSMTRRPEEIFKKVTSAENIKIVK